MVAIIKVVFGRKCRYRERTHGDKLPRKDKNWTSNRFFHFLSLEINNSTDGELELCLIYGVTKMSLLLPNLFSFLFSFRFSNLLVNFLTFLVLYFLILYYVRIKVNDENEIEEKITTSSLFASLKLCSGTNSFPLSIYLLDFSRWFDTLWCIWCHFYGMPPFIVFWLFPFNFFLYETHS